MLLHRHVIRRAPKLPPPPSSVDLDPPTVDMSPILVEVGHEIDLPTARPSLPIMVEVDDSEIEPPIANPFGRARSRHGTQTDGPTPSAIVDLISFVFGRSALRALVGADALRTVLGRDSGLFPEPGVLELQVVWDLLETQPGFVAEQAMAPMCRLKQLEARLDLDILLPVALETLDAAECQRRSTECTVRGSEIERILCPEKTIAITRVIEVFDLDEPVAPVKPRRTGLAVLAAVIGLAAAGISADLTFNRAASSDDDADVIEATEISSELPLLQVQRSGSSLMATLADRMWVLHPAADRTRELEGTVVHLQALGATSLVVADVDGAIVASVALDGSAPAIALFPHP